MATVFVLGSITSSSPNVPKTVSDNKPFHVKKCPKWIHSFNTLPLH
ncbi:hypothetical protein DERF_008321 [Dermatophagoides farinae]|uniref:Uncharacterized protein n=1 Tax=Dermatophagoides farinae TaxID=6954 RepID=A0A922L4M5_DERFA|nr:hypothetical protein DERF_008321 [Dermatophagoides farinae]